MLPVASAGTLRAHRFWSQEKRYVNSILSRGTALPRSVMSRPRVASPLVIAGAVAIACALVPQSAASQEGPLKSTQDGVFSEDQARRGEETFQKVCAACHLPEQFGETFIQSWAGATVGDLYDLISSLMPEDQPGSLEPEEYVAVLSYIFKMNGLPPGPVALDERREILGSIRIER